MPIRSVLSHPSGDQWVQANEEPVAKNQYRVKGLPVGEKMLFRVVAVNVAGRSPPAILSQAVTIREIMGQTIFSHTGHFADGIKCLIKSAATEENK